MSLAQVESLQLELEAQRNKSAQIQHNFDELQGKAQILEKKYIERKKQLVSQHEVMLIYLINQAAK